MLAEVRDQGPGVQFQSHRRGNLAEYAVTQLRSLRCAVPSGVK